MCHLLFGCEIMKFFSTGLLLVIVFGSLEGSTIPHKRTVRALNATIQTHFNGTIQRRNPCTNNEVERSSYRGCHEFHHHSKESNWSDYTRKCATLISDFFHAISNLVTFKDRQSGTFDLNINTKVSHKTDGVCADTKKPICPTPTVVVESTDCEVLPSTSCDDLPTKDTHSEGSEICSLEGAVNADEQEEEKCSVDSEISVNEEPQSACSPSFPENDRIIHVTYTTQKIPELQSTQEVNPPEIKSTVSNIQITIKPDTTVPSSTVPIFAPKETLQIGVSEIPQQSTGTDSASQVTPFDSKDYPSGYTSQPNEEKIDIHSSSSATQSEDDKVVPEYNGPSIEFSDKIALYNVHKPEQKSLSPSTQHYLSDTTTPSTFEIQSDYDVQDTTASTQPTSPQYQSESYDEPIQSSQAVTFTPAQSKPENYVNQYNQVASDLPTSSPSKGESTLEFSDQLAVYNVRQPRPESPSSSSLLNIPTSVQPPSSPELQPENYVNYEDGIVSTPLPTSTSPPKQNEPSIEFSDQLAVYNVRQTLPPTTTQATSSEPQPDNYDSYEDETEPNEMTTPSSPSVNVEPSVEFSDQLSVYNIRAPTTTYPPSPVSQTETTSAQPSVTIETQTANYVNYEDEVVRKQSPTIPPLENEKPSIEFSDQLALYNVREPLPGTTTPIPLVPSSIQPASDSYINYEDGLVSQQPSVSASSSPSPQPEEGQYVEYSDQLAANNAREPLPGTTTPFPLISSSIQPSASQPDNYVNYENDVASNQTPISPSPQSGEEQYEEYADQLPVNNIGEPLPGTTISSPLAPSTIQPASDSYMNYEDGLVTQQPSVSASPSPQPREEQYVEYSEQLPVNNVRETLPGTSTPFPLAPTSIQPSVSQSDNYVNYENDVVSNQTPTSPSPQPGDEQYVEYSGQLTANNVREPLPTTTTSSPAISEDVPSSVVTTLSPSSLLSVEPISIQPSSSEPQSDSDEDYEGESEPTTLSTPVQAQLEPSVEYSDQLAVYNVREPLPGTTTLSPLVPSTIQPASDSYMNYEDGLVTQQPPVSASSPSPQPGEEQYVEYSDQLAANNVGEPLSTTTTLPSIVSQNIPSSVVTTLSPSSLLSVEPISIQPSSSEPQSDSDEDYEGESEPTTLSTPVQAQVEPSVEYSDQLAVYNVQEPLPGTTTTSPLVPSSIQPSSSQSNSYIYEDYKDQETYTSRPMSPFTTPAGSVVPTTMPSSEYIDNNGPVSPSSDYPISQDIGGFVPTSLPSYSDDTSSFNNIEQPPQSQPTSTLLPTEAQQVFSDQVSDIREPQSDSSVSDGRISDMVTPVSQIDESESSDSYDDESSLTDSQQIIPSESQPETTITNEYSVPSSSNQPLPNSYDIYDEQSSTSANEPTTTATYPQYPINMITTLQPSTKPENFGIYDEPQGTYPPKIENESFTNYEDNVTPPAEQASVSIEPLSENDSSEIEPTSSEEESPSEEEEENGNVAVSDDQGLLPLSPHTFRPTVPIETTVNYADQTPFRPTQLPSSFGALQENNIIYDEGIFSNETEPSAPKGEEAKNPLNASSELTKQNESKELDSSTTLTPELEFDTYYDETFKQPTSSDSPKINNYVMYEDDVQTSSPKSDLNTTSNDYSTSLFPSTPSFTQEMITTPSTSEPMSKTYTDYEYSKTDLNSQTTFPPQIESVLYGDQSTQQPQSVDYAAYDIQSTTSPKPKDQEKIDISDQLSIYNVPESVLESSSPLSELFSSNMVTTSQPTASSDDLELEMQPTFSPESYDEESFTQTLPPKDLNEDTYVNYEDTTSSSQLPTTTTLLPNKVEPSLEYSDQLPVYNVRQPRPESPSSSSLLNIPTSVQPPSSPESQPENYVNYEDGVVSTPLPTSTSPPKQNEPSIEFSDQLAVYNVRQTLPPTTTQATSSEPQPDNYDSYEDETEPNEMTTPSSPSVNVEPFIKYSDEVATYKSPSPSQSSSPSPQLNENIQTITISTLPPASVYDESVSVQTASPRTEPESEEDYEDQIVSNGFPTTPSSPQVEPSVEFSDELAIYNVRQPSTVSPPSSVSYAEPSPAQPSIATQPQPENYVSYDDERPSNQIPTTSSPQPGDEQYVEYSDQLAANNVREPLSSTTTSSPAVNEYTSSSFGTTLPPLFSSSRIETYDDQTVGNVPEPTFAPEMYDEPTSAPATSFSPAVTEPENSVNYETGELPTSTSPPKSVEPFLEYSDEHSDYNVRQPEYSSSSPTPVTENLVTTTSPSLPSNDFGTNDSRVKYADSQPTFAPESDSQLYDEPSSVPASSTSQPDLYTNYDDKIVSNEFPTSPYPPDGDKPSISVLPSSSIAPSPSPSTEGPFSEYSDQLSIYNVRQPELGTTPSSPSDYVSTSSSQLVPESQVTYDDYTAPKEELLSTPPTFNLPQSQDYSVPPSNYSADQDFDYQTTAPVVSGNIPSSITTLPSPSFIDALTSPQPSLPESQSDSYEDYEDVTASTTLSTPVQVEPSVEYSDPLAAFNVLGPAIVPISASVNENASSGDVTTSLPSSSLIVEPTSPQSLSSDAQSDSNEDYEDETVSTPSPVTAVEPSDELSMGPSELSSPSSLSENIQSGMVTTFAPSLPSDKFESYDYQPVGFESQPTYNTPTSAPSASSQPRDDYVNYEDEIESNEPVTTLPPPMTAEPSVEYSDELTIYNVRPTFPPSSSPSPQLNENIAMDTVSTYKPAPVYDEPTSVPSTYPEEQPDDYVNYDDPSASNTFPITYSPIKEEPSMISSDQLPINTTSPQSSPTDKYEYDSHVEYTDSPTRVPTEPTPQTSIGPLTSSQSQPEQYVNYEDERVSVPSPTSTYPPTQVEPSVEYSDQLSAYNVREPLSGTTTPFSLTSSSIQPSVSQSDDYVNYENDVVSNQTPTSPSPQPGDEQYVEYSDQLAANNVREPLSTTTTSSPAVSEDVPSSVVTTLSPSSSSVEPISIQPSSSEPQSDSDEDYEGESEPTTLSTPVQAQVEPSVEYSDQLSAYNVREPLSGTTTPFSLTSSFIQPSVSQLVDYVNYENDVVSNQTPTSPSPQPGDGQYVEYSDQLAANNVREPLSTTTTSSPAVSEDVPSSVVTTLSPSSSSVEPISIQPSSSEPQSDSDEDYEDESEPTTLSTPVQAQVEPSVEYSDQLAVYNVREPLPGTTTSSPLDPSTIQPVSDSYMNYEDGLVTQQPSVSAPSSSPQPGEEQYVEYSDQLTANNVRESLSTTTTSSPAVSEEIPSSLVTTLSPSSLLSVEPISIQPSSSELLSDSDEDYESESEPTTLSTPVQAQVEPSVEYSDQLAVYNVREPLPGTTTSSPLVPSSIQPSSSQSDSYIYEDYKDETVSKRPSTTLSTPVQVEPSVEYSDPLATYNDRQPEYSSSPSPLTENISSDSTSSPQSDSQVYDGVTSIPDSFSTPTDENYENKVVPNQFSSSLSPPAQVEPSLESSDQLSAYNVNPPDYSSTSPSPLNENYSNEIVTITAHPLPSDGFGMYDSQVLYTDFQPTSAPQSDSQMFDKPKFVPASSESQTDNYVNYEDKTESRQVSSSLSPPVQVEPSVEYADELSVDNVREPIFEPTFPPVVNQNIPSSAVTTSSPSSLSVEPISIQPSSSEPQSDSDEDYEGESEPTTLSTPVQAQVEPSVEYSDQLAVYNVRDPVFRPTSPPVASENIANNAVVTFSPGSDTQSDSNEDYEDEIVSTLSPVTGAEPSIEVSDELSVYNVRQRPSEMTTPSPFNNNVISNLMTTISPYFTFQESSSKDSLNTISQTTVPPEYDSDMYDEPQSSIQPSQSSKDDSQAFYDETTSKDFLPETLSDSDEQTISNVIQSTQSPDLSNQLPSKNEVEFQKISITTPQPNVESPVITESTAEQEFDYQPTLSPDYEAPGQTVTTPPSSSPSQDNYVVYEDQTVSNELTTSSPVKVEPSLEYSDQLDNNTALLPETSASYSTSTPPFLHVTYTTPPSSEGLTETYTDYEGSTANPNSPSTPYDEPKNPDQVQTSTSPQPQIVNYDYYNDQAQKPEESSASPPITEIETDITLTELGPTLPPNFESQLFEKSDFDQSDNYIDDEDSIVSTQIPTSSFPQTSTQPPIEFSDELAVYNVRKPYFEPTSVQPSSQSQPENYDTYEDQVIVSELSTPSTPQKAESTVTQSTSAPEGETQIYDEPTTIKPLTSSQSQPQQYVNYEDERVSVPSPTSTYPPTQVEPSVEYSDQLSAYNVREPLSSTTTSSPAVSEDVPSSVVTTLSPSSLSVEPISIQPSSSELQSDGDEDYEGESEPTTLSTPVQAQLEPSVEYSDQLAVYNVLEPVFEPTSPPVVSENIVNSEATTLSPSSSLIVEQTSPQSPSDTQLDSNEDYEDETVSTFSPVTGAEPSLEASNELSIYNVRQRPSEMTTPSPFNNNVMSNFMTTISPYFTSSSNDYEDSTFQSSVTSVPEPEIYDEPYSTSSPSSESASNTYVNSEDRITSDDYTTPSSLSTEAQQPWSATTPLEYPVPPTVYNVPQRPSELSSSSLLIENLSDDVVTTAAPSLSSSEFDSYDTQNDQNDELKISPEEEPKSYDDSASVQNASPVSQPENYMIYEDEIVKNGSSTTPSSPQTEPSVEFSDELAIYNVRQPSTVSPPSSVSYAEPSPAQPSIATQPQPENYVSYDDERPSNQIPTTSSPQPKEEQYFEYSDQLPVTNVREPLPGTTTLSPLAPSTIQPVSDSYMNYEDGLVTQQPSVSALSSPSPQLGDEQYVEYSDQLTANNVREPLPATTTLPSVVSQNIPSSVVTTLLPSSLSVEPISIQTSSSELQSDSDEDYEGESEPTTLSTPVQAQVEPSVEYSDQLAVYNVREPLPGTTTLSPLAPSTIQPVSDSYMNYEDGLVTQQPSVSASSSSPQLGEEQYVEYSDQLAANNVRESLSTTTTSSAVSEEIPSSLVTTLSPSSLLSVEPISIQPSSSELLSDSDEDYESESEPTTLSTPVQAQVEPSVEYSDQLAVYNVREPLPGTTTSSPLVPSSIQPSSSQSDSYIYEDYKDETVSKRPSTTLSTPIQVEPSVEYSDPLATYNVRQPELLTSPSPLTKNYANDLVTTVAPSLGPGGFETYDNQVIYADFQPTSTPQSESQIYDEPTSIPASFPESQKDDNFNYDDKMTPNVAVTSASPPVNVDVEYSDNLAIYNVRQPSTTTPPLPDRYLSEVTSGPVYYTYDDLTESSDSQTFSPETDTEYDESPTTLEPQTPTQSYLEAMTTTFQPRAEPQIDKTKNQTSTPSKQQQVSTFPPLHPFIPLNQPLYSLPVESQLVSEQQDQVIPNQVVNSPLVPSSELNSEQQSNNFSNLVKSQETGLIDGVENTRRGTPQPEPFALAPDQTNPSNEPGEDYVTCTCTRGNGRSTQHALMCPFNPVLKGNMTAPSYYILISKLSGGSDKKSLPDEESFQVEKVYLGDGTPLNCTEERKPFPTSKYTPVPISSARTVKLPIRLNNA